MWREGKRTCINQCTKFDSVEVLATASASASASTSTVLRKACKVTDVGVLYPIGTKHSLYPSLGRRR